MLAGVSTEEEMNQEELIIDAGEEGERGKSVFPFLFRLFHRVY